MKTSRAARKTKNIAKEKVLATKHHEELNRVSICIAIERADKIRLRNKLAAKTDQYNVLLHQSYELKNQFEQIYKLLLASQAQTDKCIAIIRENNGLTDFPPQEDRPQ